MGLLIILFLYTVALLYFVPGKRLQSWQDKIHATVEKWKSKLEN